MVEKDLVKILLEIKKNAVEIIDLNKIQELISRYYDFGENYNVKLGFDPTGKDLHLGHTVILQKLRIFQKYGAIIHLLIGDFTAKIGDPTGKNKTREILDKNTILENAKRYKNQVFKILDKEKCEIVFNSSWLNKLGADGLIELTSKYSIARMLERDDFKKRYSSKQSISISEFIYPLLQGYDSVILKSDIEIGGIDQKFNLLMGRYLQRNYNLKKEQAILMMPILEGTDGVQKMSKSLNNYIGIEEKVDEIYGKILSISDNLMWKYYELLSNLDEEEIKDIKNGHPKEAKEKLALEIISRFYNLDIAKESKKSFNSLFKLKEIPDNIQNFKFERNIWICKSLVDAKLEPSTSQARRDIRQGAVKINQKKILDENFNLDRGKYILQVGKRKFAKVEVV